MRIPFIQLKNSLVLTLTYHTTYMIPESNDMDMVHLFLILSNKTSFICKVLVCALSDYIMDMMFEVYSITLDFILCLFFMRKGTLKTF